MSNWDPRNGLRRLWNAMFSQGMFGGVNLPSLRRDSSTPDRLPSSTTPTPIPQVSPQLSEVDLDPLLEALQGIEAMQRGDADFPEVVGIDRESLGALDRFSQVLATAGQTITNGVLRFALGRQQPAPPATPDVAVTPPDVNVATPDVNLPPTSVSVDSPVVDVAPPTISVTGPTVLPPPLPDVNVNVPAEDNRSNTFLDAIAGTRRDEPPADIQQPPPVAPNPITIEPPRNLFESAIESMAGLVNRITGTQVRDGETQTQASLDRFMGQAEPESRPETITQAINPVGDAGAFNRDPFNPELRAALNRAETNNAANPPADSDGIERREVLRPAETFIGPMPSIEVPPLEPPQGVFERVVEAGSRFAARISRIQIPKGLTATQAVLDHTLGRVRDPSNAPRRIAEAVLPIGQQGIMNRLGNQNNMIGRAVGRLANTRIGAAAARVGPAVAGAGAAGLGFLGIVGAAFLVVSALRSLAASGVAAANRVAQFGGQLLAGKTQLEVGRMIRDIQTARALGPQGRRFFENQNRMEELFHPLTTAMEKLGLKLAADAAGFLPDMAENPVGTLLDYLLPDFMLQTASDATGFDFMKMQAELVAMFREITDKIKEEWFGIKPQMPAAQQPMADPLLVHNMMINNAFPKPPPPMAPIPPIAGKP